MASTQQRAGVWNDSCLCTWVVWSGGGAAARRGWRLALNSSEQRARSMEQEETGTTLLRRTPKNRQTFTLREGIGFYNSQAWWVCGRLRSASDKYNGPASLNLLSPCIHGSETRYKKGRRRSCKVVKVSATDWIVSSPSILMLKPHTPV